MRALAAIACVILAATAAIHFYWAAGGSFGKASAIPSRDGVPVIRPSAFGTALVGIALIGAALVTAAVAGLVPSPLPPLLLKLASVCLALVFGLRAIGDFRYVGFFKRVTSSRFARLDSLLYSPLCLTLAALIGAVAIGASR